MLINVTCLNKVDLIFVFVSSGLGELETGLLKTIKLSNFFVYQRSYVLIFIQILPTMYMENSGRTCMLIENSWILSSYGDQLPQLYTGFAFPRG